MRLSAFFVEGSVETLAETKRIAVGVFEPELAGVPGLIFGSRAGLFCELIDIV